jgi:hypothetical protein
MKAERRCRREGAEINSRRRRTVDQLQRSATGAVSRASRIEEMIGPMGRMGKKTEAALVKRETMGSKEGDAERPDDAYDVARRHESCGLGRWMVGMEWGKCLALNLGAVEVAKRS